jgi:hypothetical protein
MFCAGDRAEQVLGWAFENQEAIMQATRADAKAAQRMASAQFPDLARCIGSAAARNKLNLALRFAVKNRLQVLTPQVFVQGLRLCDEDTDLGLDYALPRLVERARTQPVQLSTPPAPQPAIALQPPPQRTPQPRPLPSTTTPTAVAPPQPAEPAQPALAPAPTNDASRPEPPPPEPPPPTPPEPPAPAPQAADEPGTAAEEVPQ